MSEQVRILFDSQGDNKQVTIKGFRTNEDRFTIGTIEKNEDFLAGGGGVGDYFGLADRIFKVGEEVSEADFITFADDNGYDMIKTTGNDSDVIFDELPAPSALTAVKAGGSPTDTIDLAWTDNSDGGSQDDGFKIERRFASQEVTTITCDTGANHNQGDYVVVKNQAGEDHLFWLDLDDDGTEPTTERFLSLKAQGRAIEVDVLAADDANELTDKVFNAIDAAFTAADMTVTDPAGADDDIIVSQDIYGKTEDAIDSLADGSGVSPFVIVITADGDSDVFAQVDTVAQDVEVLVDTPLTPNTQYFYRVRAFNADGDSSYSNVADDTTDA